MPTASIAVGIAHGHRCQKINDPERVAGCGHGDPFRVENFSDSFPWAMPTAIDTIPFGDAVEHPTHLTRLSLLMRPLDSHSAT